MEAIEQTKVKNGVLSLLVDQIQPNKKGHLIIEKSQHGILHELQQAGFIDALDIDGCVVDIAYNTALIRFFNRGGFT